jgi:hypothetical protein
MAQQAWAKSNMIDRDWLRGAHIRLDRIEKPDPSAPQPETTLSVAARSLLLRLLAESHLESIGKIQTQGQQCDDDGNEEETETDNQHMFHARRIRLAGKCAQGFLLRVRASQ